MNGHNLELLFHPLTLHLSLYLSESVRFRVGLWCSETKRKGFFFNTSMFCNHL